MAVITQAIVDIHFKAINKHQAVLLGERYPQKRKWKVRLVGKEIEDELLDVIISLKGLSMSKRNEIFNQINNITAAKIDEYEKRSHKKKNNNTYQLAKGHVRPKPIELKNLKAFYYHINQIKKTPKTPVRALAKHVTIYNSKIKQTSTKNSTNIYLMQSNNFHKIGKANNVSSRLSNIKTSSPNPVTLTYSIKVREPEIEFFLHDLFAKQRIDKSEWFKFNDHELKCALKAFKRFDESGMLAEKTIAKN
jgi:hypothetical protein